MTAKTNIARQRRGDVIDINDRTNIRKRLITNTVSNIATTPWNTKQQGKGGGIPFNEYDKYNDTQDKYYDHPWYTKHQAEKGKYH